MMVPTSTRFRTTRKSHTAADMGSVAGRREPLGQAPGRAAVPRGRCDGVAVLPGRAALAGPLLAATSHLDNQPVVRWADHGGWGIRVHNVLLRRGRIIAPPPSEPPHGRGAGARASIGALPTRTGRTQPGS